MKRKVYSKTQGVDKQMGEPNPNNEGGGIFAGGEFFKAKGRQGKKTAKRTNKSLVGGGKTQKIAGSGSGHAQFRRRGGWNLGVP